MHVYINNNTFCQEKCVVGGTDNEGSAACYKKNESIKNTYHIDIYIFNVYMIIY